MTRAAVGCGAPAGRHGGRADLRPPRRQPAHPRRGRSPARRKLNPAPSTGDPTASAILHILSRQKRNLRESRQQVQDRGEQVGLGGQAALQQPWWGGPSWRVGCRLRRFLEEAFGGYPRQLPGVVPDDGQRSGHQVGQLEVVEADQRGVTAPPVQLLERADGEPVVGAEERGGRLRQVEQLGDRPRRLLGCDEPLTDQRLVGSTPAASSAARAPASRSRIVGTLGAPSSSPPAGAPRRAARCTPAWLPPRLSNSTASACSPCGGRSRNTTGMPSSTSRRRNEWSRPAGTTSSPSTRRWAKSWSRARSRSGSSSERRGDQHGAVGGGDLGGDAGDGGVERVGDLLDQQPDGGLELPERRLRGDVVAPEAQLGDGGQHPVDQLLPHRLVVDDPGDRLQADPGAPGHVDHRGAPTRGRPGRGLGHGVVLHGGRGSAAERGERLDRFAGGDQHRIPYRRVRRSVAQVEAVISSTRHAVPQRHGERVDPFGRLRPADDLRAEQPPGARSAISLTVIGWAPG